MSDRCRRRPSRLAPWIAVLVLLGAGGTATAQWVVFVDETAGRLSAPAEYGAGDVEEKDYAWGDVDRDGDIDLVVVRKQPFTTTGKRVNRLFLNENGVLVDRTADYVVLTDVTGDQGFLTPTNDRDVQLADVDGDGWLDIITAVTLSDGDPKHIGHPRIYMNRGQAAGTWLGFRFQNARIPTMLSYTGSAGFNPRFCSVAVGDLTGDGRPDLWFGDYDSSGEEDGQPQPEGADFNDRLLINDGNGYFQDATVSRLSGVIEIPGATSQPFEVSSFGASAVIADMNDDGVSDIVKQTSLTEPIYVGVGYNDPDNEGFFDTYRTATLNSPYFISVGDLNNDERPDIVVTDDGADFYLLNQGNNGAGLADFVALGFNYDAAGDDGFGGNSVIADLNNDGWSDVLIADVDVDTPGCSRRMHIYRNLGGTPGSDVVLKEITEGTGCDSGNPATCTVAGIPADRLQGVHDVAVFDLDGDQWLDLVVGRCDGTEVYLNHPSAGVTFAYPQGLPTFVAPGSGVTFQVQLSSFGAVLPLPGSARMFAAVGAGAFAEVPLTALGGDLYEATLPAVEHCAQRLRFYFTGEDSGGGAFTDPPNAPLASHEAIATLGLEVSFEADMEGDVSGWTVINGPLLVRGAWERAVPVGTVDGFGQIAAPSEDAEASTDKTQAFVTQNGVPDGPLGAADVDGGPTDLISPALDLAGTDGTITYSRWFYSSSPSRVLDIAISNNGGQDWTPVEQVAGTGGEWQVDTIRVSTHVAPTADVRVRFRASDQPNTSLVEAGIDAFSVERFVCGECNTGADCDDGLFCNGLETCVGGACVASAAPCPGQECDETGDACVECLADADCDDGDFCNGAETCSAGACAAAGPACPAGFCDPVAGACVDCLVDATCDDGVFCNGPEACVSGRCADSGEACPGRLCDEGADVCVGTVRLQPILGQPLYDLTPDQYRRFQDGRESFSRPLTQAAGLGPVFNQSSCGSCHNTPLGGSGSQKVTRFAFNDDKGGGFDELAHLGGSLRQAQSIRPECAEVVPPEANIVVERLTNSTLGSGLVEAIPDAAIEAHALDPPAGVSGRIHLVELLEDPGAMRVGRFGWKAQVASVLSFAGDAALNEMGLTNRLLPQENAPNGDAALLAQCDEEPDPEDGADAQGRHFIDRVSDFQRFLAPPPQTPRSGMTGEAVFNSVGCASCHVAAFTTADDAALDEVLRNRTIKPYSDFLLHDMGLAADFIAQGGAGQREVRTPPLWGLRVRDPLWHDGRILGGTFMSRMTGAIDLHNRLGSEAAGSAQAFAALSMADKAALVAFLDSLGRAEFDLDGDGLVNAADYGAFRACFSGPGVFYTPDDPCSPSDVDQDGDVDDDDFLLFLAAASGFAGRIPDNAAAPGTPLVLDRFTDGQIRLTWSPSCRAADTDYGIYEGVLGQWTTHTARQCSTGGATEETLVPSAQSAYYLVVPSNGFKEGSYGDAGPGAPRPAATAACFPQSIGECSP